RGLGGPFVAGGVHVSVFGVDVGVELGDRVEPVFFLAACGGHVQAGPVHGGVGDGVAGVHGGALGAVHGRGVPQMHMLVDVVRRQDHLPVGGARGAPHAQCSVITNVLHGEQITVGHPPYRAPGVVEKDLIPASNDGVSGGDLIAPADGELVVGVHLSGVDVVLPHKLVDGLTVAVAAGHDQRLGAGAAVVQVRLDSFVDHVGAGAATDPVALGVHLEPGCVTVTQSQACLRLLGIATEAHHLVEHGGSGDAGQLAGKPAGGDGGGVHRVGA